jgi:hypothetical protein
MKRAALTDPRYYLNRQEQILLLQVGCEARKRPAVADVFFLTSPFIETYLEFPVGVPQPHPGL